MPIWHTLDLIGTLHYGGTISVHRSNLTAECRFFFYYKKDSCMRQKWLCSSLKRSLLSIGNSKRPTRPGPPKWRCSVEVLRNSGLLQDIHREGIVSMKIFCLHWRLSKTRFFSSRGCTTRAAGEDSVENALLRRLQDDAIKLRTVGICTGKKQDFFLCVCKGWQHSFEPSAQVVCVRG